MSTLFSLKTSTNQLSSANKGTGEIHYAQYAPSRDVTGDNFAQGTQYIRWECSGKRWWIPKRSYIRFRCTLSDGAGNQLVKSDDIAPNMFLASNLFQSLEFKINGKTICRVADYVAQIEALEKRMTKSKTWLDTTGNTLGFSHADFAKRQAAVIENGTDDPDKYLSNGLIGYSILPNDNLGVPIEYGNVGDTYAIAINGVIDFAQVGAVAFPDLRDSVDVGDYLCFTIANDINVIRRITAVAAAQIVVSVAEGPFEVLAATPIGNNVRVSPDNFNVSPSRNCQSFEIIWQPPLSIFKVNHALPSGSYELVLNPQNINTYKQMAVESDITTKEVGLSESNFQFSINDMYMYVAMVEGPRVENASYLLDLEEINCQRRTVQAGAGGLLQEEFSVSPSTCALTLAFQDDRAGTVDTLHSASKFKVGETDEELDLIRMYINYAATNRPTPDADPQFDDNLLDYTVQRYVDSALYTGTFFTQGGAETIEDWHERGAYYHFNWPKDQSDRSTRVFTNYQFEGGITHGTALLFNHYKQAAMIKIVNGMVQDVQVQDM